MIDAHGSFITHGPRYSVLQCRGLHSWRGVVSGLSISCMAGMDGVVRDCSEVWTVFTDMLHTVQSLGLQQEFAQTGFAEFKLRDHGR